jgi:hypothetical protein
VATINEHEEPVLQDSIESIVAHEEEQQYPHVEQAPTTEAPPEDLKELENQSFLMTTKSMNVKNFKWRVILPHLKKP